MLKKKLLTLACAVGILACGACFVPALIDDVRRPQPPPLHIDLTGIRRIDVAVTDVSQLKKLNVHNFADEVKLAVDDLSRDTRVKVRQPKDSRPAEGTLQITVLEESVTQSPAGDAGMRVSWTIKLLIAASLTTRTGQEIWHQSGQEYTCSEKIDKQDADRIWNSGYVSYTIGERFVHSMFYGDPHDH